MHLKTTLALLLLPLFAGCQSTQIKSKPVVVKLAPEQLRDNAFIIKDGKKTLIPGREYREGKLIVVTGGNAARPQMFVTQSFAVDGDKITKPGAPSLTLIEDGEVVFSDKTAADKIHYIDVNAKVHVVPRSSVFQAIPGASYDTDRKSLERVLEEPGFTAIK